MNTERISGVASSPLPRNSGKNVALQRLSWVPSILVPSLSLNFSFQVKVKSLERLSFAEPAAAPSAAPSPARGDAAPHAANAKKIKTFFLSSLIFFFPPIEIQHPLQRSSVLLGDLCVTFALPGAPGGTSPAPGREGRTGVSWLWGCGGDPGITALDTRTKL